MNFLGKLQSLPKRTRKIILWTTIVVLGVSLFFVWLKNLQKNWQSLEAGEWQRELNLPSLGEELEKLPQLNESR